MSREGRARELTGAQIKEAIERLVALIEGEESRETLDQNLDELVRGKKADEDDLGGEMDVLEV